MQKLLIIAAIAGALATAASAAPSELVANGDLASMNLEPTKIVNRDLPTPQFAPDRTPTSFRYDLPAPGMGAVVGYKPYVDTHPIQAYEVNQATAIGFNQPSSSVGAALAYRF